MNKKNKTESSYLTMFKQKIEGNNPGKNESADQKKGINFEDLKDWDDLNYPSQSNQRNNENGPRSGGEIVRNAQNINQNNMVVKTENIYQPTNNISPNNAQVQSNNTPNHHHDEFSVRTSYFTNKFGEIGNNVDKFDLSNINNNMIGHNDFNNLHTNLSNKKINFNMNSSDNITQQVQNYHNLNNQIKYEVIEEEEELKHNQSKELENEIKNNLKGGLTYNIYNNEINQDDNQNIKKKNFPLDDDSLDDDSDFSLKINDDLNITQNQLEDMNKELKDIKRKIKLEEREVKKKEGNAGGVNKLKDHKMPLEPIINNKLASGANSQENNGGSTINTLNSIKNKPKRKHSPYLRNFNTNKESSNATNSEKPISIQTYQTNTNIMHFQTPMGGSQMMNPMQYGQQYPQMYQQNMPYPYQFMNMYPNNNNQNYNNYPNFNNYSNILPVNGLLPPNYYTTEPIGIANNTNNNNSISNSNIRNNETPSPSPSPQPQKKIKKDYKPYTIKDYKENINKYNKKLPSGLGPNIGGKEWEEKQEKKKKIKEYSDNIKTLNKVQLMEKSRKMERMKIDSQMSINKRKNNPDFDGTMDITKGEEFGNDNNKENEDDTENDINDDSLSNFDKKLEKDLRKANDDREKKIFTPDSNNRTGYSHIHNIRNLKSNQNSNHNNNQNPKHNTNPNIVAKNKFTFGSNSNDKKLIRPKSSNRIIVSGKTDVTNHNKIYTTLNQDRIKRQQNQNDSIVSKITSNLILNTSEMTNTSKLNSSKVRATSSKARHGNIKKENDTHSKQFYGNHEIETLIQNHNFYHDKVEKIRNFVNKF